MTIERALLIALLAWLALLLIGMCRVSAKAERDSERAMGGPPPCLRVLPGGKAAPYDWERDPG